MSTATKIKPLNLQTANAFVNSINDLNKGSRQMFADAMLEGYQIAINDLEREKNRQTVDTTHDFANPSEIKVLKAKTLIDAMSEMGMPFELRHESDIHMSRDEKHQWNITAYHSCGCAGDCCGCAFQTSVNIAKVGRTWVGERSVSLNY